MGQEIHKAQQEKKIVYVYVAGPFSQGNKEQNIAMAVSMGDSLIKAGFVPFIPHLTHLWEQTTKEAWSYEDWLQLDFRWLMKCDAVVRLPGRSPGADREVSLARQASIPVFLSFEELLRETKKDIPDELRW